MDPKHYLKRDIRLPWQLIHSEAFLSLSGHAKSVLIRFYQKCPWTVSKKRNRGRVTWHYETPVNFPLSELRAFGFSESNFYCKIIPLLVARGFIDVVEAGAPYDRKPSVYRVSQRWEALGTAAFIEVKKPKQRKGYKGYRPPGSTRFEKKTTSRARSVPLHKREGKPEPGKKPHFTDVKLSRGDAKVISLKRAQG